MDKLKVLKKPLTKRALKARADKDGRISVNIAVSLEELMTDIESLNDLADERILDLGGCLSDIVYEAAGIIPAQPGNYRKACTGGGYLIGQVILNVNADVSDLL